MATRKNKEFISGIDRRAHKYRRVDESKVIINKRHSYYFDTAQEADRVVRIKNGTDRNLALYLWNYHGDDLRGDDLQVEIVEDDEQNLITTSPPSPVRARTSPPSAPKKSAPTPVRRRLDFDAVEVSAPLFMVSETQAMQRFEKQLKSLRGEPTSHQGISELTAEMDKLLTAMLRSHVQFWKFGSIFVCLATTANQLKMATAKNPEHPLHRSIMRQLNEMNEQAKSCINAMTACEDIFNKLL